VRLLFAEEAWMACEELERAWLVPRLDLPDRLGPLPLVRFRVTTSIDAMQAARSSGSS